MVGMKQKMTWRAWRIAIALGSLSALALVAEAGRRWA
jgi:hypothetical protein